MAEAVVGFEYSSHGARPVLRGVVAFEKDKEAIIEVDFLLNMNKLLGI